MSFDKVWGTLGLVFSSHAVTYWIIAIVTAVVHWVLWLNKKQTDDLVSDVARCMGMGVVILLAGWYLATLFPFGVDSIAVLGLPVAVSFLYAKAPYKKGGELYRIVTALMFIGTAAGCAYYANMRSDSVVSVQSTNSQANESVATSGSFRDALGRWFSKDVKANPSPTKEPEPPPPTRIPDSIKK